MKSEKGITLMSLIIYIIVMCIVVAILATISDLFYSNSEYLKDNSRYISEYNKFNMYFLEDVKNNEDTDEITTKKITFNDGTTYTYQDNGIYRNKVKICENISYCKFSKSEEVVNEITKNIIEVHMIIDSNELFATKNEYVLKYW